MTEPNPQERVEPERPPRDNLVRLEPGLFELREGAAEGDMPTLVGHFAVFNQWTEINSMWEGQFMERIAPGAFKKTFTENAGRIKVLFNHGQDPSIGDKVLGMPSVLEEDTTGARYEVPLYDTTYNRDLLPGLRDKAYGASFRFSVMAEEFVKKPTPSTSNPGGLPERTITQARVPEFGPVTFPAYAGATAGVRSATDEYVLAQLLANPEALVRLLTTIRASEAPEAGAAAGHPGDEGRTTPGTTKTIPPERRFRDRQEYLAWISSTSTP